MKPKLFFKNRTALQAFFILLIGFLVILGACLFIFFIYINLNRSHINRNRFAIEFIKIARLADMFPDEHVRKHHQLLKRPHFRVVIRNKPLPNAKQFDEVIPKELASFARQQYPQLSASILLKNGQWLIVRGRVIDHPWLLMGVILSSLLLLIALFFLCYWVVRLVSMPTDKFLQAAKRFGVDIQSPPMSVAGPPEIQEVIKAFNEMQARIRRLITDRTQMLAAISHDLRTPITRLQLRAEYLKGTSQYEKAIGDLNEMDQMISSILSFARDYATTEPTERFDINALLESLCNDMADVGYSVNYKGTDHRVTFLGRISALKRAFGNLIENAIKYGNKANVVLSHDNRQLQIKISDEGPGIPEEEMENVFAPFYRVDKSRSPKKSGTGLGLAVARDIIRSHGGEIKLFNRDPHGLNVIISFPLTFSQ